MSRTAILLTTLQLLVIGGCNSNTPNKNADEEIIALERSALEKWSQSNTRGYVDISADDVTWFDFTPGKQLRIDGIEEFRNFVEPMGKEIPPHKYALANPKVQLYGNTAILTYHWNASTPDGQPIPSWKATSVYNWKDGKWSMVHCHYSIVQAE